MSARAIVALSHGSRVAQVAHGSVYQSRSGSLSRLRRNLRIASRNRFVSYRIGSTLAEAWASQNGASTLVSPSFLEDSYAPEMSLYSISRMGVASEDGTGGNKGSLRWVTGALLAATATAIVAARQEEKSVPRWDPSHLLSRLSSQPCSLSKLIPSSMELVESLVARWGAFMAVATSVQVQASEYSRVGQGVGMDEAVGEELVRTDDDRKVSGKSIDDFYAFDRSEQPVGWGGYSTVFQGTSRSTGQAVAVKMVSREHSSRREVSWVTDQEVRSVETCFLALNISMDGRVQARTVGRNA